ncbi:MAG: hypothetical protein AAGN82_28715 [Myxococcota bacterium]
MAGPNDTVANDSGGVRFYTVDWELPAATTVGGLELNARAAQVANANILVDLPDNVTGEVVLSLTYSATSTGLIQQWDGQSYNTLGVLPRSATDEGTVRWMRTTMMLDTNLFDYENTAGTNVLLQLTNIPTLHRIKATPID